MALMVWKWKLETACSPCTRHMIPVGWWLLQYHVFVHDTCGTNKQEGNVISAVIDFAAFEIVAAAACMPAGA